MRLDSITKIERFIENALLSSPLIPLGVNVLRLADVSDEEGILQMVNSVIVRYVSSNVQVVRQSPMATLRTMTFEVNIASQSYLTQSGHDFAVQLCAAVHETLSNTVPTNTGMDIVEPFHLSSENFSGLTDSSHYTYTQQWNVVVQDVYRPIALDPCVARGDCSRLFSPNLKDVPQPGDVLYQNEAYIPALPPPPGEPYSVDNPGVVETEDGSLVYRWEPTQVFLSAEQIAAGYTLVSTNTFDESGTFLIVDIKDGDGNFVDSYFAVASGRIIIKITVADGPSAVDVAGNPSSSAAQDVFSSNSQRNSYGYTNEPQVFIYVDPTNPLRPRSQVGYNVVFPVEVGTTLVHDGDVFLRIGNTVFGRAWIKEDQFTLMNPNQYLPNLDCEEDPLEGNTTLCE
jgi:hypothetical protein